MRLALAEIGPFKSVDRPQSVAVEPDVTVLVGMNEAGKTVFLQGLNKCRDVMGVERFNPLDDYPRKDLPAYLRTHDRQPAMAVRLTYELSDAEVEEINGLFQTELPSGFRFSIDFGYDNKSHTHLEVDERPVLRRLMADAELSDDALAVTSDATSLRALRDALSHTKLTYSDHEFLSTLEARIGTHTSPSIVGAEIYDWLQPRVPQFLYFGDYEVLPSKMNLKDLAARASQSSADPGALTSEHRGVMALLRMADIEITDFARPGGYETLKAKIEGVSIALTDQIMEFWKQNEDLEVQIDIAPDPYDEAPFSDGPNLYLRIKNRRHRGVSTPFKQRSRGFIWFFSFLVWFDSVQQQLAEETSQDLILLLDEPGLSLHALAQRDLLKYIETLSFKHQVIYTTHSPFLVDPTRLHQVRTVEDRPKLGSTISAQTTTGDPRTLFPLRAALAWSLTEQTLAAKCNLLVEQSADLLYLSLLSSRLGHTGQGLRPDIALVPVGGLAQVAQFGAIAGASSDRMAVLLNDRPQVGATTDSHGALASAPRSLSVSAFRADPVRDGSDIEDLLDPALFADLVAAAYADVLEGRFISVADLPAGDRIIDRVEQWMGAQGIFVNDERLDRYRVAAQMALRPDLEPGDDTRARFATLFSAINSLF